MPSQDNDLDDLDELLKEMEKEKPEGDLEESESGRSGEPDLDFAASMTEEEIARLLALGAEGAGKDEGGSDRGDFSQGDVLDMLDEAQDRDLREIKSLLEKSDRNEAVGGDAPHSGEEPDPADRLLADIEKAGEKEVAEVDTIGNADQRRLKKEQRKKEKAAKKEAKRNAKLAAKSEKKKKPDREDLTGTGGRDAAAGGAESSSVKEFDMLLDKDLLDSIVSGAGQAGQDTAVPKTARQSAEVQNRERAAAGDTEKDTDGGIASLLDYARADLESSEDPEADWVERQMSSPGLDIMALDMEEADGLIADISEREGGSKAKEGLLSKVFSFLTEEETEAENEDVQLSDENEEILNELDNEKTQKKSASKKAKKSKKKKTAKKEKKAKPKKPPKPKKEKKPRETEPYPLGKRITFKKALPIIVFGISLGLAIFIITSLTADYSDKKEARAAYMSGDYEGCYLNLFGKKLDEAEEVMFGRSESILYINLWYREYEKLAAEGAETEALDSLIQTVVDYPGLYAYAARWNAGMDVYEVYLDILDILYSKYGLTEAQAQEIAAVRSDLEYTRIVTALAQGYAYDSWKDAYLPSSEGGSAPEQAAPEVGDGDSSGQPGTEAGGEELPDELPEEGELDPGNFTDNQ